MITAVHHDFFISFRNLYPCSFSLPLRDESFTRAMFAQRRAARLTTLGHFPLHSTVARPGKRQFTSSIYDGFLDLAIALPWPSSFPPYSSTIILLTVASRLALTVPFSVWVSLLQHSQFGSRPHGLQAKRRQWRTEELVVPALQEAKPLVQKQVLHEMRVEQARGTKEELRKVYDERVKKNVRHLFHSILFLALNVCASHLDDRAA